MPLPIWPAPLSTNLIADEVGYTQSIRHELAGPLQAGGLPGTFSLSYFFRPGNVRTKGVTQSRPFGMSAFHGEEAIYRCTSFTASNGITGSATIVRYYKQLDTVTFGTTSSQYCIRQNWDGRMAISNLVNATYSIGATCYAPGVFTTQSGESRFWNYGQFGVRVYQLGQYDSLGRTGSGTLSVSKLTAAAGGTFSNRWWANTATGEFGVGATTSGRLNNTGSWNLVDVPTPGMGKNLFSGFGTMSFSINVPQTRVLYMGIGSDDFVTIKVDNVTILKLDQEISDRDFKFWHIYPITFSAGIRQISLLGQNNSGRGSIGVDIYGNTFGSLQSILDSAPPLDTATPSLIDIIYSSQFYKGNIDFYNTGGGTGNSLNCVLSGSCCMTGTASVGMTTTTTTTTSTTTTTTTSAYPATASMIFYSYTQQDGNGEFTFTLDKAISGGITVSDAMVARYRECDADFYDYDCIGSIKCPLGDDLRLLGTNAPGGLTAGLFGGAGNGCSLGPYGGPPTADPALAYNRSDATSPSYFTVQMISDNNPGGLSIADGSTFSIGTTVVTYYEDYTCVGLTGC